MVKKLEQNENQLLLMAKEEVETTKKEEAAAKEEIEAIKAEKKGFLSTFRKVRKKTRKLFFYAQMKRSMTNSV